MNEILKLIETRHLYVHLILFKIYLETPGATDTVFNGDMRKELKELFGDDYTNENYRTAEQFLESEGITKYNASCLTKYGRSYFEEWIKNFQKLDEGEKETLVKKLPPKVIDFFKLTEKSIIVMDFISKVIDLGAK